MVKELKLIIFDLERVIVTSWHDFYKFVPDLQNVSHDKLKDILDGGKNTQFNRGEISEQEFLEAIKQSIGTTTSTKQIKNAIEASVTEIAGIRYIVSELKGKYKLALLSNFPKVWFDELNTRFGLRRLFDEVFVSGYTGVRKPDPNAYKQVLYHFGISGEETLFIDDKEMHTEGAKQLGIQTIVFRDVVQLSDELRHRFGITFSEPLHIFRSYDVRGIFNLDLSERIAEDIGKSLGTYIGIGKTISVARDYRNGGGRLHRAFVEGVLSTGVNVVDHDHIPTPIFYFSIIHEGLDGGAMITASHNPPMWNGFKMCGKGAEMISEEHGMEELREIFVNKKFNSGQKGKHSAYSRIVEDYTEHVLETVKLSRKLKVVLDPGNGTWCGIAKKVFEKLGCEVIEMNGHPNGSFPGRGPDPNNLMLSGLKADVVKHKADFGAGYDADGDRASFIDDTGNYVGTADKIVPIFASFLLSDKVKGGKVIYDVPCSTAIEEVIRSLDGIPIMNRTGHSHIMARMVEESAILGGEYSNHIYFPENFNLDDGAFASMKMAELLSKKAESLSALSSRIPSYPAIPIREVYCPDDAKFEVVKALRPRFEALGFERIIDIDGVKAFNDDGWVLARASNTMPQIKINSEGKSADTAQELFDIANRIVIEEIAKRIS
ncbi:MAG: HAD-IA family hydrolase [Candidatus Micrarchaeota archaeon]|nr:HAD-IA family hydrolase [Candidatus Micrarchaeota archaeon]MDE1847375.1 HAD-IA family hydrolase [Candidatus Micrarchaeota archaeon]MDE1863990.1 HAD-IA family hydrolase [Candidatus Micrarchaeota archaeon]